MSNIDPISIVLNQTSGSNSPMQDMSIKELMRKEIPKKTYSYAEFPRLDPFSKDPVSQILLQGGAGIASDNPLEDLLRNHDSNSIINPEQVEEKDIDSDDEVSNPIIVRTNDDEDDNTPITLSFRQPSYSSLHGTLVQKGSMKNLPELDNALDKVEEKKTVERKHSKDEFVSSAEKLKIELNSQDNPVIVATSEDEENNDNQAISLSFRQPSFSNLTGQLIPKGASAGPDLPLLDEEPAEVNDEADENCAYGPMIRTSSTAKHEFHPEEDEFEDLDENDTGKNEDNSPIMLGVRQPSFSNLNGQMILKGSTKALPKFNEDNIIVEDEPKGSAQQILLEKISEKDPVHGEILRSLHEFNEERWKDLGYDPNKESEIVLNQQLSEMDDDDEIKNVLKSHNSSNCYPRIIEVTKATPPPTVEKKKTLSVRKKSDLIVEMPDNYDSKLILQKNRSYEEGDSLLKDDDSDSSEDILKEDPPRQISSAGGKRNSSQLFDILPDSMINNNEYSDDSNSPIKEENSRNENKDGLDSDFYLSLDEIRTEQAYDSEQGSSRIPPNLYKMITHPKESVVFLSLCGVSIAGYSEKTVNYVVKELKGYLNKCVDKGMIEESMYVENILKNIKEEKNMMKKADEEANEELLSSRIIEANNEIEKREQYWDRQEEQLNAQKELAINELEMKRSEAIDELNYEWDSDKMKLRYNKPSSKLIELRRTAQRLINVHRFEEAAFISVEINELEEKEVEVASKRMEDDYELSVKRLNEKFDQDKETVNSTFEMRRASIKCSKEKSLIPVHNRAARVQHEKERIQKKKELRERKERASLVAKSVLETNRRPLPKLKIKNVVANKKLVLPPLKKMVRPLTSIRSKE